MKIIVPEYYPRFRCIAGACRHSCCIGWEIDIDSQTLASYQSLSGDFGIRLRENMDCTDDCASFRLDDYERCPFLNTHGLCEIILTLGEDALCQVCADHPRFRADFSDRTEIGLGLCCEAAAELILAQEEPVRLIVLADDGGGEELTVEERALLTRRDQMLALAQDRRRTVNERMETLCGEAGIRLPERSFAEWAGIYRLFEQLDPRWGELLAHAVHLEPVLMNALSEGMQEQLLVYFLYRHLAHAEDAWDFAARTAFAVHSVWMIGALCTRLPHESPAEIVRMYSSEVEYSEENTAALLDELAGGIV